MSFDQAILHHKTYRRPYRGAKAIASISCCGPASKNGGKLAGGARFVKGFLPAPIAIPQATLYNVRRLGHGFTKCLAQATRGW